MAIAHAVREWARPLRDLVGAAEVDHRPDAVAPERGPTRIGHRAERRGPDQHAPPDRPAIRGQTAEVTDIEQVAPGEAPIARYAFQRGGPGGRISGGRMLLRFASSASGMCSDGCHVRPLASSSLPSTVSPNRVYVESPHFR